MAASKKGVHVHHGRLVSQKSTKGKGLVTTVCAADWFKTGEQLKIAKGAPNAASQTFDADDLNYLARVLYAESSGSGQLNSFLKSHARKKPHDIDTHARHDLSDQVKNEHDITEDQKKETLDREEKMAILHVIAFRLNRAGYASGKDGAGYVGKTFREVCDAPHQFQSTRKPSTKFTDTEPVKEVLLDKGNCDDLNDAIHTVRKFMNEGADYKKYPYDAFGLSPYSSIFDKIGGTYFWASVPGGKLIKSLIKEEGETK